MTEQTYRALVVHDDETSHVRVEATSREEAERLVRAELDRTEREHFAIRYVQRVTP